MKERAMKIVCDYINEHLATVCTTSSHTTVTRRNGIWTHTRSLRTES